MTTVELILIIIGALIVAGGLFWLLFMWYVSWRVFQGTLVRTDPSVWARACSEETNEEQLAMWNEDLAWAKSHGTDIEATQKGEMKKSGRCEDLMIENDGLKLYGQYFDFGCKRAVIIIPGRCESLMYSYFFAPAYEKAGFNVLVIDIRAHGMSDGKYDPVGVGEHRDTMKWGQLLHDKYGNEEIWIHGICMGANTGVLILTAPECPSFFKGLVSEGMYISFKENYRQHMIYDHHPTFPIVNMVMKMVKKHTGTDVDAIKPIDLIDKVHVPVLFIAGRNDFYSKADCTVMLYEKCGAPRKEIAWFEDGNHSHLRFAHREEFDNVIRIFTNPEEGQAV